MGKLNLAAYDPTKEGTTGRKAAPVRKANPGALVILRNEGQCWCGCLENPTGPKRSFKMGHDARMKGMLIRAHLTDTPVVIVEDGKQAAPVTALVVAKRFDWQEYLKAATDRQAAKAQAKPAAKGVKIGDQRKIKVGRWEKDAIVVGIYGDNVEFEYEAKGGAKRVTKPMADVA